jgi:hypothetical protein
MKILNALPILFSTDFLKALLKFSTAVEKAVNNLKKAVIGIAKA